MNLLVTKFTGPLPATMWEAYWRILPAFMREKNNRYHRWQDRHAHLFGALLLVQGLKKFDIGYEILNDLQYTAHNRPFLHHKIDFNISHSGNYVLCALDENLPVGVDIEEVRAIDFNDFNNVMSDDQMSIINASSDPVRSFFTFWTIKECVIKADGRGLSIPLADIHIDNHVVEYDCRTWYVKELVIDNGYCAHLASAARSSANIEQYDFYEAYALP
jgi:4'-phosphopantetheinyl transferase